MRVTAFENQRASGSNTRDVLNFFFFLGKLSRIVGPGLYFYIPLFERVLSRIDTRIITYTVPLQRGLTKDNVPVEVDAIVFYQVKDSRAAILSVDNYHDATQIEERHAIRDRVGKSKLDEMCMEGRSRMVFVPTEKTTGGIPGEIRSRKDQ